MSLEKGIGIIREHLAKMPTQPGVYRMLGEDGKPLYIGKAKNLPKRVLSYTKGEALTYRLQRMVSLVASMEVTITKNEAEALLLEANLVRELQPKYNILLKDDKSFPYILLTSDKEFNMLQKFRGKKLDKGQYFGPFPSAHAVNQTLSILHKAFPLRSCTDNIFNTRHRPCLEYQIKRCTAPCVDKITKEDYDQIVNEAKMFLRGKSAEVQKTLAAQMQIESDNLHYEKAARLRDRIKVLTKIQEKNAPGIGDADVISMYREGKSVCIQVFFIRAGQNFGNRAYFPINAEGAESGEIISGFMGQFYQTNKAPKELLISEPIEDKEVIEDVLHVKIEVPKRGAKYKMIELGMLNAKSALERKLMENTEQSKLLNAMVQIFGLGQTPERIEIYDNSHTYGQNAIGAMVVANAEGFDKKSYRKYNIKRANLSDDYDMMREMLTRRFTRAIEEKTNLPEVAIIDGGAGQLSVAAEVMAQLGVHEVVLIAIAKGPERNAGNEEYHMVGKPPFRLEKGSALAFFMQRLRDEAHRFAITTHRAKRDKAAIKSELDTMEGIGPVRKKALLHHFGSVAAIKQASVEDLSKVTGINQKTAESIYNYFHSYI